MRVKFPITVWNVYLSKQLLQRARKLEKKKCDSKAQYIFRSLQIDGARKLRPSFRDLLSSLSIKERDYGAPGFRVAA